MINVPWIVSCSFTFFPLIQPKQRENFGDISHYESFCLCPLLWRAPVQQGTHSQESPWVCCSCLPCVWMHLVAKKERNDCPLHEGSSCMRMCKNLFMNLKTKQNNHNNKNLCCPSDAHFSQSQDKWFAKWCIQEHWDSGLGHIFIQLTICGPMKSHQLHSRAPGWNDIRLFIKWLFK